MFFFDVLTCGLLIGASIIWWIRRSSGRGKVLVVLGVVALCVSVTALLSYRWQAGVAIVAALVVLVAVGIGHFWSSARFRSVGHYAAGLLIGFLTCASILSFYWFPLVDLTLPTGPYSVGVRDFTLVDHSRANPYVEGSAEPRRLAVRVWYPAEQTAGIERRPYLTDLEAETTMRDLGEATPIGAHFFQYLKYCDTNSYDNAPLLANAANLPAVLFSHGYRGYLGQNTVLMEHLASHGYLAFAVQHTHDSSATVFADGEVVQMDPQLKREVNDYVEHVTEVGFSQTVIDVYTQQDIALRRRAVLDRYELESSRRLVHFSAPIWVEDQLFAMDSLAVGDVPVEVADIVSAGAFDQVGLIGMSFGGSTASTTCMLAKRCAAAVNLDGDDRHKLAFNRDVPMPMLVYTSDIQFFVNNMPGGEDEVAQDLLAFHYEKHATTGLRPDFYRIWVPGVTHYSFSDFAIFLARNNNPLTRAQFGTLDGTRVNEINTDVVRGFLDKHLRDIENDYPNATIETHKPHLRRKDPSSLRDWWLREHAEDENELVAFTTTSGDWGASVYPVRTPIAAAHFMSQIDSTGFADVNIRSHTLSLDGMDIDVAAWPSVTDFSHVEHGPGKPTTGSAASSASSLPFAYGALTLAIAQDANDTDLWFVNLGAPGKLRDFETVADTLVAEEVNMGTSYELIVLGHVLYGLPVLEKAMRSQIGSLSGLPSEPVTIARAYHIADQ